MRSLGPERRVPNEKRPQRLAAGGAFSIVWLATAYSPTTSRSQYLDLRLRWRAAYDSIRELEGKVASLRNDFYTTDDPYYRDSQIKPAWDRALEGLETARSDIDRYQTELRTVLNEGRREGALPGWLREGIEHEPEAGLPAEETIDPSHYSVEPTIYDEGNGA